jgi:hypothetical protein
MLITATAGLWSHVRKGGPRVRRCTPPQPNLQRIHLETGRERQWTCADEQQASGRQVFRMSDWLTSDYSRKVGFSTRIAIGKHLATTRE